MSELLSQLKRPFEPKHLSWKPGATKGDRCLALAYADLRAYMERLDEVCGLDWSVAYEPWHENRIICRLTISGVTRSSTGEMDSREEKSEIGGTSAEAQSFKRACAMFGLGRFLYDLPAAWVAFDAQAKRITDAGQKELDGRYITWYNKTIAALVKEQSKTPRQVDASTGEIVDSLPVATDVIFQAEEPATHPVASQSQQNRMHALGQAFHGSKEAWEAARPVWVKKASGGRAGSSKDLSPEQSDWIIASLEKRLRESEQQQAQQPIAQVA